MTYFTGFYAWYNEQHPLTTFGTVTPNQFHTRQAARLLAARQTHQTEALASRHSTRHSPFTLAELIAEPLPDVSQCPVYFWAASRLRLRRRRKCCLTATSDERAAHAAEGK